MLVVHWPVYTSTLLLIAAENLPVCVTARDILKITQTRETRMDGGHRGCEALCICCTFTWGLDCSEALGLWNAVEHMVMDYCVNTGIQIQLDGKTVAGLWRTWKVVFPSFLKVAICSRRNSAVWTGSESSPYLEVSQKAEKKEMMLHIQLYSFINLHRVL